MKLKGGPYSGQSHTGFKTGGSLVFEAGDFHGHYDRGGSWRNAPPSSPDQARALGYRVEEPTVLNVGDRTTSGAIGQS